MSKLIAIGKVAEINPRLPRGVTDDNEKLVSFVPMSGVSEEGKLSEALEKKMGEVCRGYTYFERGDILLAKISPCMENGKAAYISDLPHHIGFGSTEFQVLRPGPEVDGRYLFYMVWNPEFRFAAANKMSGAAGQQRVPTDFVRNYQIPLPPLDEQRRIAAILDKADAIRRKRQESIRLTEEFLRSTFLEMFGDIPSKKSSYDFGTIRGFVSAQSGKSSNQVLSQEQTDIPIYGGNGINGWATKALFEDNVIVVGRVGQQCGIVHITDRPVWVTDNAIVLKITDYTKLHPIYVAEALQKSPLRSTVEQLDLPFINQATILDHPIPLPPLDMQLEFVKIRAKTLESAYKLNKSNVFLSQMFNSLTHRAFRGEL